MSDRPVRKVPDPVLEALIAVARVAIQRDRDVADRRATMVVVVGGKRGGPEAA